MKKECRVYRNKVFFYGNLAVKVEKAIKLSKLSPEKWLERALINYMKYLRYKNG